MNLRALTTEEVLRMARYPGTDPRPILEELVRRVDADDIYTGADVNREQARQLEDLMDLMEPVEEQLEKMKGRVETFQNELAAIVREASALASDVEAVLDSLPDSGQLQDVLEDL